MNGELRINFQDKCLLNRPWKNSNYSAINKKYFLNQIRFPKRYTNVGLQVNFQDKCVSIM